MENYGEVNSVSEQNFKQYFSIMLFLTEKLPLLTCSSGKLRAILWKDEYAERMILKCLRDQYGNWLVQHM